MHSQTSFCSRCFTHCFLLASFAADRPNILWITSEDNGPQLGCYGDQYAETPNIDALAAKSLRYRRCWSNAPVCAPARTTTHFRHVRDQPRRTPHAKRSHIARRHSALSRSAPRRGILLHEQLQDGLQLRQTTMADGTTAATRHTGAAAPTRRHHFCGL